MRKSILVLSIMLLCLLFGSAANAQSMGMMDWKAPWLGQIEQITPAPWASGQYATYHAVLDIGDEEPLEGDLRCAVVGQETVDGAKYNWFELDIFNIGSLPADMGTGDEFQSFRVKLLMKEYDFSSTENDPKKLMDALINQELIKRIIFQKNEETPQELDMSIFQMMAPMMQMALENPEMMNPEGTATNPLENADWGSGKETVTTSAGTFTDCLYLWFTSGDPTSKVKMNIYSHGDIPLTVLVKVKGEITDTYSGKVVNMDIELAGYGKDAATWIKGEPVLFNLGDMGMGMPMGEGG